MCYTEIMNTRRQFYFGLLTFALTAPAFYLGQLHDSYWFFIWIFPIPVILYSFAASQRSSILVSFFSLLVPALSVLLTEYYRSSVPTPMEVIPSLLHSLIFTALIVLNRYSIRTQPFWLTPWVLPSVLSLYQFVWSFSLLANFLHFGISNQTNFLPIAQLTALLGPVSLSFIMHFFATSLCTIWYFRHKPLRWITLSLILIALLGGALSYGYYRLAQTPPNISTYIALGDASPSGKHNRSHHKDMKIIQAHHLSQTPLIINSLANSNPNFIVLPEMWLSVNSQNRDETKSLLQKLASSVNSNLIVGVRTLSSEGSSHNAAWIIDQQGQWVGQYNKIHLIPEAEQDFTPGQLTPIYTLNGVRFAVEISTDSLERQPSIYYGQQGAQLVFILSINSTLHGNASENRRVAILRGISNGFAIARVAAFGELSLVDPRGRVIARMISTPGATTSLSGSLPIGHGKTFYSTHPNLFGYLITLIVLLISLSLLRTALKYRH